jgi:hypothetical protein
MSQCWKRFSAVRRATGSQVLMFALVCVGLSVAGCTTSKPFAQLEGYRWNKTEINTYDAVIVSIDGKSYPYNDRIIVEPGQHHLVLQARPAAGFRLIPEESMDLNVEPCMRYWFEAKRTNALEQRFEPRINYQEPIPGCSVAAADSTRR